MKLTRMNIPAVFVTEHQLTLLARRGLVKGALDCVGNLVVPRQPQRSRLNADQGSMFNAD
jgi:hypothetical protein